MNAEIWLWLLLVMLPYNNKTMNIVKKYENVRKAAEAIRDGIESSLSDEERQRAKIIRSKDVQAIITECRDNNIRIVTIEDDEYPDALRNITEPPIVLFVQGSLVGLDEMTSLAVVGTRSPSKYSVGVAQKICSELARNGIVLVSGLAVGLDTVAHSCALANGAKTIGVLACGNLINYPAANRDMKKAIIQNGGAIISELLPHTTVTPEYFKHRNRIISGLCKGTFIVEAPEKSGCLLTAEHTVEQGRELFCLPPHDVTSPLFSGVIPYLRDGATPVFGAEDTIYSLCYGGFPDNEEADT